MTRKRDRGPKDGDRVLLQADERVREAARAGSAGRHAEAVALYGEALELDPSSQGAREGLAATWISDAKLAHHRGHLGQALKAYLLALEVEPDSLNANLGLGEISLRVGDLETARGALERYLDLEGKDEHAHLWLGSTLHGLGFLELATEQATRAREGGVRSEGDLLLSTLELESRADIETSRHFEVRFLGSWDSSSRQLLLTALERAYDRASATLGLEAEGRLSAVFNPERPFSLLDQAPCQWHVDPLPGIRIPVQGLDPGAPALTRVLRHEVAHALARGIGGPSLPAWLEEGLARRATREHDRSAPPQGRFSTLASLGARAEMLSTSSWDTGAWMGEAAADLLLERGGKRQLHGLLTALGSGVDMGVALAESSGLTLAELETSVESSYRGG